MHVPSKTEQDYLKQIYLQHEQSGRVTTQDLSMRLGVKPSSVTAMLKHLADDQQGPLVRHTPYHGVALTALGRTVALETVRHHRLIELFLSELLGMPWDRVHEEAERLEHVISEDLEERIAAKLGYPAYDPHGDPIPSRDGQIPPTVGIALRTLPIGVAATVMRVPDGDPSLLQFLQDLGLVPGAVVQVEEVAAFGDVLTLSIGGQRKVLGGSIARRVLVCPEERSQMGLEPHDMVDGCR
jgi:DtxR family Mn-dependent transcriptional regulator